MSLFRAIRALVAMRRKGPERARVIEEEVARSGVGVVHFGAGGEVVERSDAAWKLAASDLESLNTDAGVRVRRMQGSDGGWSHVAHFSFDTATGRTAFVVPLPELSVGTSDGFVAMAAHELGTPIGVLRAEAERVLSAHRHGDDVALREGVAGVVSTAGTLARLVESVADASRLADGSISLRLGTADLRDVVEEVVHGLMRAHLSADVRLESAGDTLVRCDRGRIEQVVYNLLKNASTHGASPRGVDVCVDGTSEDSVQLIVRDYGRGLPQGDLSHVFRPHSRSSRASGGLGIGLWVVDQMARLHGGNARAEQTPGGGATITVELSRSPTDADQAAVGG